MSENDPTLWDQPDPATEDNDRPSGTETARAALRKLEEEGTRETIRIHYARLMFKAATDGVALETDEGDQVQLRRLTDKEAAKKLGCQNTTAGARRNELMGDDPRFEDCPIIVPGEKRHSHVGDAGTKVVAWEMNPAILHAARSQYS